MDPERVIPLQRASLILKGTDWDVVTESFTNWAFGRAKRHGISIQFPQFDVSSGINAMIKMSGIN